MKLFKYACVLIAVLTVAACVRTGDGIRDDSLVLAAAKALGTRVFVKNFKKMGSQLLHVTLNGVKIAELGDDETVIVNPLVGENVIKLQRFGLLKSPNDGATKTFSMEDGQKRFFVDGTDIYPHPNPRITLYRPIVVELRPSEFFSDIGFIKINKFGPPN